MATPAESENPEVLVIILARGGSKQLPSKNVRLLAGKPLIVHSIEHALEAELVDRVVVTTDSEEIATIAREAGAEVPFMRPPELGHGFGIACGFAHSHLIAARRERGLSARYRSHSAANRTPSSGWYRGRRRGTLTIRPEQ